MAVLQSTNVQGALCVNGVAVGGGKDFKYCCYTASSTFTPSQDLVDGNGFLSADLVAGGGGAGSYSMIGSCFRECFVVKNCTDVSPQPGGFIQNPVQKIDSISACTVTIGAGGLAGTVSHPTTFYCADCNCLQEDLSTMTGGGKGGDTCFGSIRAYGGKGGSTIETVINRQSAVLQFSTRCCNEGAADAAVPAYQGYGTGLDSTDDRGISGDTNGYCQDIIGASENDVASQLQFGGSAVGGKVGASGFRCANGCCQLNNFGRSSNRNCSVSGLVCRQCSQASNGWEGTVVDWSSSSGSVYGDPAGWQCLCGSYNFYAACCRKSALSASVGPGAQGIVVLKWQE